MFRTRIVFAGLLVAAAACNSSDTTSGVTGDDATVTADVAAVAADGVAEDVDVMIGMDGGTGNITASLQDGQGGADFMGRGGFHPGLTGCTFVGGSFNCPDTNRNGLSITRTITFLDASSASEPGYDSLLTASIHILAEVSGDRTHGPWTATVDRHRDFTITGLAGTETTRTVNGTGDENVSQSRVTRNDSTRSYTVVGSSTVTDVVLPVRPNGGNGWPVSGTITRTFTITQTSGPNNGRTVTRTVTITFNGSGSATASINGSQFTIDLANHTCTAR
jgi:hypothetical protein